MCLRRSSWATGASGDIALKNAEVPMPPSRFPRPRFQIGDGLDCNLRGSSICEGATNVVRDTGAIGYGLDLAAQIEPDPLAAFGCGSKAIDTLLLRGPDGNHAFGFWWQPELQPSLGLRRALGADAWHPQPAYTEAPRISTVEQIVLTCPSFPSAGDAESPPLSSSAITSTRHPGTLRSLGSDYMQPGIEFGRLHGTATPPVTPPKLQDIWLQATEDSQNSAYAAYWQSKLGSPSDSSSNVDLQPLHLELLQPGARRDRRTPRQVLRDSKNILPQSSNPNPQACYRTPSTNSSARRSRWVRRGRKGVNGDVTHKDFDSRRFADQRVSDTSAGQLRMRPVSQPVHVDASDFAMFCHSLHSRSHKQQSDTKLSSRVGNQKTQWRPSLESRDEEVAFLLERQAFLDTNRSNEQTKTITHRMYHTEAHVRDVWEIVNSESDHDANVMEPRLKRPGKLPETKVSPSAHLRMNGGLWQLAPRESSPSTCSDALSEESLPRALRPPCNPRRVHEKLHQPAPHARIAASTHLGMSRRLWHQAPRESSPSSDALSDEALPQALQPPCSPKHFLGRQEQPKRRVILAPRESSPSNCSDALSDESLPQVILPPRDLNNPFGAFRQYAEAAFTPSAALQEKGMGIDSFRLDARSPRFTQASLSTQNHSSLWEQSSLWQSGPCASNAGMLDAVSDQSYLQRSMPSNFQSLRLAPTASAESAMHANGLHATPRSHLQAPPDHLSFCKVPNLQVPHLQMPLDNLSGTPGKESLTPSQELELPSSISDSNFVFSHGPQLGRPQFLRHIEFLEDKRLEPCSLSPLLSPSGCPSDFFHMDVSPDSPPSNPYRVPLPEVSLDALLASPQALQSRDVEDHQHDKAEQHPVDDQKFAFRANRFFVHGIESFQTTSPSADEEGDRRKRLLEDTSCTSGVGHSWKEIALNSMDAKANAIRETSFYREQQQQTEQRFLAERLADQNFLFQECSLIQEMKLGQRSLLEELEAERSKAHAKEATASASGIFQLECTERRLLEEVEAERAKRHGEELRVAHAHAHTIAESNARVELAALEEQCLRSEKDARIKAAREEQIHAEEAKLREARLLEELEAERSKNCDGETVWKTIAMDAKTHAMDEHHLYKQQQQLREQRLVFEQLTEQHLLFQEQSLVDEMRAGQKRLLEELEVERTKKQAEEIVAAHAAKHAREESELHKEMQQLQNQRLAFEEFTQESALQHERHEARDAKAKQMQLLEELQAERSKHEAEAFWKDFAMEAKNRAAEEAIICKEQRQLKDVLREEVAQQQILLQERSNKANQAMNALSTHAVAPKSKDEDKDVQGRHNVDHMDRFNPPSPLEWPGTEQDLSFTFSEASRRKPNASLLSDPRDTFTGREGSACNDDGALVIHQPIYPGSGSIEKTSISQRKKDECLHRQGHDSRHDDTYPAEFHERHVNRVGKDITGNHLSSQSKKREDRKETNAQHRSDEKTHTQCRHDAKETSSQGEGDIEKFGSPHRQKVDMQHLDKVTTEITGEVVDVNESKLAREKRNKKAHAFHDRSVPSSVGIDKQEDDVKTSTSHRAPLGYAPPIVPGVHDGFREEDAVNDLTYEQKAWAEQRLPSYQDRSASDEDAYFGLHLGSESVTGVPNTHGLEHGLDSDIEHLLIGTDEENTQTTEHSAEHVGDLESSSDQRFEDEHPNAVEDDASARTLNELHGLSIGGDQAARDGHESDPDANDQGDRPSLANIEATRELLQKSLSPLEEETSIPQVRKMKLGIDGKHEDSKHTDREETHANAFRGTQEDVRYSDMHSHLTKLPNPPTHKHSASFDNDVDDAADQKVLLREKLQKARQERFEKEGDKEKPSRRTEDIVPRLKIPGASAYAEDNVYQGRSADKRRSARREKLEKARQEKLEKENKEMNHKDELVPRLAIPGVHDGHEQDHPSHTASPTLPASMHADLDKQAERKSSARTGHETEPAKESRSHRKDQAEEHVLTPRARDNLASNNHASHRDNLENPGFRREEMNRRSKQSHSSHQDGTEKRLDAHRKDHDFESISPNEKSLHLGIHTDLNKQIEGGSSRRMEQERKYGKEASSHREDRVSDHAPIPGAQDKKHVDGTDHDHRGSEHHHERSRWSPSEFQDQDHTARHLSPNGQDYHVDKELYPSIHTELDKQIEHEAPRRRKHDSGHAKEASSHRSTPGAHQQDHFGSNDNGYLVHSLTIPGSHEHDHPSGNVEIDNQRDRTGKRRLSHRAHGKREQESHLQDHDTAHQDSDLAVHEHEHKLKTSGIHKQGVNQKRSEVASEGKKDARRAENIVPRLALPEYIDGIGAVPSRSHLEGTDVGNDRHRNGENTSSYRDSPPKDTGKKGHSGVGDDDGTEKRRSARREKREKANDTESRSRHEHGPASGFHSSSRDPEFDEIGLSGRRASQQSDTYAGEKTEGGANSQLEPTPLSRRFNKDGRGEARASHKVDQGEDMEKPRSSRRDGHDKGRTGEALSHREATSRSHERDKGKSGGTHGLDRADHQSTDKPRSTRRDRREKGNSSEAQSGGTPRNHGNDKGKSGEVCGSDEVHRESVDDFQSSHRDKHGKVRSGETASHREPTARSLGRDKIRSGETHDFDDVGREGTDKSRSSHRDRRDKSKIGEAHSQHDLSSRSNERSKRRDEESHSDVMSTNRSDTLPHDSSKSSSTGPSRPARRDKSDATETKRRKSRDVHDRENPHAITESSSRRSSRRHSSGKMDLLADRETVHL